MKRVYNSSEFAQGCAKIRQLNPTLMLPRVPSGNCKNNYSQIKTIITLLLSLLSLSAIAQEITGKVYDENKKPLKGAIVTAMLNGAVKGRDVTNSSGAYTIKLTDTGNYTISATHNDHISATRNYVIVHAGKTTTQIVLLKKKAAPSVAERKADESSRMWSKRKDGRNIKMTEAIGYAAPPPSSASYNYTYYNPSTETYKKTQENDYMNVKVNPLSTMSVDVDRASYSNVRRFINEGQKPPADAVRVEEMINYFDYNYPQPRGDDPIAIHTELTDCPWQKDHKLLHIGIQARKVNTDNLPASNLVFLIDVSGSMTSADKLPLLIAGMKLLVQNLRPQDHVAIVTYAGNAGLVLPSTSGSNKQDILDALNKLTAGGSTAGGEGIKLAYKVAAEHFIKGGNNRILLATDGDFNVGVSNENELEDLITKQRETGIYLTCLGFGTGNYKDSKMELLADKGNGNYSYIDNIQEAQKTLVSEFGGTLFTIAKDVKAQIEFNPSKVQSYRLVGYENRLLNEEDFKDDKKDAGDMGSGHTVTIIYEIIPAGVKCEHVRAATDLKYQEPKATENTYTDELATIKFRYKKPDGDKSKEMVHTIADRTTKWENASENTRFSEAVALFGMLLKDSKYKGSGTYEQVIAMAENSRSYDTEGYRAEFIRLAKAAKDKALTASVWEY